MTKKHDKLKKREVQNSDAGNSGAGSSATDHKKLLKKYKYNYEKDYSDKKWPYHYGRMDKSAKITLLVFPICMAAIVYYFYRQSVLRDMVRTPVNEPKVIQENSSLLSDDRFWGTYRSNTYFGMKTRSRNSPVFGLMWMQQYQKEMPPKIRHWCDQNDRIPMYGWFAHDGTNFGIQEIYDSTYTLSTDFVKKPGGNHGGDWTARFRVNPMPQVPENYVSLFFYVALDGEGRISAVTNKQHLTSVQGFSEKLGNFEVLFPTIKNTNEVKYNYLVSYARSLDQLKEKLMEGLAMHTWKKDMKYIGLTGVRMPQDVPVLQSNFIVYQVTAKLPFNMEVLYESASNLMREVRLSGDVFQQSLQQHVGNFDSKFESTFGLKKKGFDDNSIQFAKAALSNMLGGIGYFHGSSLVKSKYQTEDEVLNYWDAPLYTGVPSRSFFPRGFLWDEGFHNLLIEKWDQSISMDIIGHWLDLMNIEGWIPREQILGVEARARVPSEFVIQKNDNANPPTLFLPLQSIVRNLAKSDKEEHKLYLKHLFPRLKTWFNWFNTTQMGPKPFTYTWKGRNPKALNELNPKTLTSGLDDYPRASHPTEDEFHVDLRCWMALASGVMTDIAKSINEPWQDYEYAYKQLTDNKLLDQLHWSKTKQRYSDYGLHTDSVKLVRPKPPPLKPGQRPPPPAEKQRYVSKQPDLKLIDSMFGYVSLFPFLLKIVEPDSLKLHKILIDLKDPNLLWTNFGLRSLAKNSPLYSKYNTEHDPPYWRGNIWINMNYLAIGALHHYSVIPGPYKEEAQDVYIELRKNVIDNIKNVYSNTGYIWENYDDNDGKGKGCHPFTGWSALVVAIMAEQYE